MKTLLLIFLVSFSSLSFNAPANGKMIYPKCEDGSIYPKILAKADEFLRHKKIKMARELYRRATVIKPSDNYPKAQLFLINKLFSGE